MSDITSIFILAAAFVVGYVTGHLHGRIAQRKQSDARELHDCRYNPKQFRRR